MHKTKHYLLWVLLLIAGTQWVGAQSKSIDNVLQITLQKVGPIYQNKQVKGYFMFYLFDKIDKKTNDYLLKILDENLNALGEKHIEGSKEMYVEDGGYDNNSIMLKVVDPKVYTIQFLGFNEDGKQISTNDIVMDKKEFAKMNQLAKSGMFGTAFNTLADVGFVNLNTTKNKNLGYSMDFYSQQMPKKSWQYATDAESGNHEFPFLLAGNRNMILSYVMKKNSMMSKKADLFLQANNATNGKRLFETSLNDGANVIWPLNAFIDSNSLLIAGLLYDNDDKLMKAKSRGLVLAMYNEKGKQVSKKTVLWDEIDAKITNVADVKKLSNIYFHSITKLGNGNYVFAGESFHRAADGVGIALSILGGGDAGVTKIVIDDMILLEFNAALKLGKVEVVKKGSNSFSLGAGTDFTGMALLGHVAKSIGAFDYVSTQFDPNNPNKFYVNYIDYDRIEEGGKKKTYYGSIAYNNGKFSVDKFPLEQKKGTTFRLLPAKDGFVTIMSYVKKDMKLNFDLVKLKN